MRKLMLIMSAAVLAVGANAALITSEDGDSTTWASQDYTTIATTQQDAFTDITYSTNNTDSWLRGQSFTTATAGKITSISALALRLDNGGTFAMDVWESFDGDGSTYNATPSKFRNWDNNWLNPVLTVEMSVDASNDIGSGGVMTVNLAGAEQFNVVAGGTYFINFRRTVDDGNRLLWQYANSDVTAGAAFGYAGQAPVTGRDFALGYTIVPEPATLGLVAAFGGGILFIRRRFMI